MTLLSVDDFREFVQTSLPDGALQKLLDSTEAEITAYAGDVSSAVEVVGGEGHLITVSRPIDSVTSIIERDGWFSTFTLSTDDWELASPYVLRRLRFGTHAFPVWRGPVRITYAPVDDTETRKIVQQELIQLDLNAKPGLASETVGAWTQTYNSIGTKDEAAQRADILSRLRPAAGMVVASGGSPSYVIGY